MSEAVTSAKNSFAEDNKEKFTMQHTSFALPNRIFCKRCGIDVYTTVTFQSVRPSFWGSCEGWFKSWKCCETKLETKCKQLIHTCSKCHKILARISNE